MEPFRFKQFSVAHDRCAHKVGTDAVLLGAWVDVKGCRSMLDIGTGSGVIALMLAQRSGGKAQIDALEPAETDAAQAMENVRNSPWPSRVVVHPIAVQNYSPGKTYDLILSNPPFFNASLRSPRDSRNYARHTASLPHRELLRATELLLSDSGKFALILPVAEAEAFEREAMQSGLHCRRELVLFPKPDRKAERKLLEFSRYAGSRESEVLILHGALGGWSSEYKRLTADFYLNF